MCVSRCLRSVGVSLVPMSAVVMVCNVLLLLPEMKTHFLLEGHVTREATWGSGLWGGATILLGARAFLRSSRVTGCWAFRTKMLSVLLCSGVCVLAAGSVCLISLTGLSRGPLCLYRTETGTDWGVPLSPQGDGETSYLYNTSLWEGVCLQPVGVVTWNVSLFAVMGGVSAVMSLLCVANLFNSLVGTVLGGQNNKVAPVSV